MVKHGMNLIQKATEHVNHGQVPVITVDQPLYAITKKIQWTWPFKYGEGKFVVMLGGLHIEMSLLRLIGDWLDGSGWAEAITAANVTTEGRVDALLKGSHIARGQWAHQVSAAALYALQKRAHTAYKEVLTSEDTLEFDDWCKQMQVSHPCTVQLLEQSLEASASLPSVPEITARSQLPIIYTVDPRISGPRSSDPRFIRPPPIRLNYAHAHKFK